MVLNARLKGLRQLLLNRQPSQLRRTDIQRSWLSGVSYVSQAYRGYASDMQVGERMVIHFSPLRYHTIKLYHRQSSFYHANLFYLYQATNIHQPVCKIG